jgi:hypothetical protein
MMSVPFTSNSLQSFARRTALSASNLPIWPATDSQRFAWIVTSLRSKGCQSMAVSTWRAQRNEKAWVRLMRNLPEVFPGAVLVHALSRPFLPATPRRTVDSYWRHHPVRADKLARALAALSGAPEGWVWRVGIQKSRPLLSFRVPPTPFREPAYTKGPGHCCVRTGHISVRLAPRPLGRPAPKSERYMAQLLRCGLELMDCAERSRPAPEGSSEAPLSRNRRNGYSRMPRSITTFPCSRSGTTIAIGRGLHCWPSGASRTCRSSIDPLMWRSALKRQASAGSEPSRQ